MSRAETNWMVSQDPEAIAWRVQQAHIDADIEGIRHNPEVEAFIEGMKAEGVPVAERIERLKAYFRSHQIQAAE